jgi:hypothetical protein
MAGETPQSFRKKPVTIQAMGPISRHNCYRIMEWADAYAAGVTSDGLAYVDIETLEGMMHGTEGDWIIKGVQGEFYPCKPDIFAATYEPVSG